MNFKIDYTSCLMHLLTLHNLELILLKRWESSILPSEIC
jgi:hypothetical protein